MIKCTSLTPIVLRVPKQFLSEFDTYRSQARQSIQFSQVAQQKTYNKGRLVREYNVGDQVLINAHSLSLLCSESGKGKKLLSKFDGPFDIIQKLSPATYQLRLLVSYGMHPVLNFAHLEPYSPSDPAFGPRPIKALKPADFNALLEFEVEEILESHWCKACNGRRTQELLVKFSDYDHSYNEWLPRSNLRNNPDLLHDWDNRASQHISSP